MPMLHSAVESRTGTFFCDRTTAQSLPRRPTDMMFAAVIALKAYSMGRGRCQRGRAELGNKVGVTHVEVCIRIGLDVESGNLPTWYRRPLSAKMVMCRSYALAKRVASQ